MAFEGFVLYELLVGLGVVFQQSEHDLAKGVIEFNVCGVGGVFLRVLVGGSAATSALLSEPQCGTHGEGVAWHGVSRQHCS